MKLPKALSEATAGTALKYHIKRALERSHSISEFSKNLELSVQKSHFSNNTLKIIEELNNGVKSASEEIKEKATKYEKALKELQKIDESTLSKEQQQVLKVFKGELDQTEIKGIDLNDLYILEQGSRNAGARKILRKHYGEESTGALTNDELLNMSEVIKNGSVLLESFERLKNGFRYAYEYEHDGVKLRLVIDDLNNGNKIFDFYSDRNFTDFRDASLHSGNHPYKPNPTQKDLTDQEDLLKNRELENETTQKPTNLSPLEQANAENNKDFLRDKIKSVFKGDGNKLKAYNKVKEILMLDNHKEQQQAFIRAIRSDETGNTLAFLIEAANLSPKANANLKSILNQTTENLTKSLKQFDLKDYEIKSVFDNLEQGTKESYNKALNEIIGKLYDDSYKVNLRENVQDATNFQKFLNDLKAQGEIDPQAKSFLRQIEENVYNPNGVTYEQLKNSRQLINAYLRNVKDPSTLGYIQKASANFLKNDIDNAIESLLKQNKSAYEKISELQKSAISDYRDMKQALELVDKAKIRDRNTQESDAINSLMKIIRGQGQKDLTNYQALTKGLRESDKERLELSMLNRLLEQSLKQDESLKVFDSAQFFNKLNEFKDDVFTTPKAKEYIDIASGFHRLFKNDAKIAESLKPATTKNLSQGLATTLSGALKYQWTKFTLGTLYRNAPDRILGVKLPKALNEATAGAALKYHIKRALERSHSIGEFSKNLELSAQKSHFSNNTLKIIEELNNGIKQASEEIKTKARDFSNEKLTNEQIKELLNNAEIPTSGRDAIIFGTNNLNPEIVEFLHKNNKKMIIEKASNKELELLKDANFKHPENIRASLNHDSIAHILKRHGVNSVNVRNGEIPITYDDIANYRYIVNNADAILRTIDKYDKEAITAFKQINGYAVVVEQAINKKNELALKTMYKNNGSYKNNEVYKEFSSTSLDADAKVRHRLSSYSGATENNTQKPLTDQEDLLKTSENLNETTQEATNLSPLEQANAEKLAKLQHAITPLKEFGTNYPEFALKPKEALEKLLQEKNGQVAGAAYREDLGGIDFVWGTPKTKDSVGYGLAHIIERREQQAFSDGLSEAEAKEYALNIVKSIPEVLEKGSKGTDHLGRVFVDYGNIRVGLNNTWNNKDLENHWVISSYELRDTTEKPTHFPTSQAITKEKDIHSLNSVEPNPTTNTIKTQEPLSPLEQANAEKLAKLESEKLESEKEFTRLKEQEQQRKAALKKKLEHERGNAGNIESATKIEVGEDIPTKTQDQLPKSRVRLNEREIYDLDYAIVKAKDLKPSFTTGGTQKRTDMNEEQIKSIAEHFDPKKIFGSGGFEDLPIILHDGQVIAGNHRIQGMLNFTPKSRYIYEKAIKEYYNIDLKPDELLVRVPHNRLNNTEINNLAASSNQGRFNSESDHAIAVLSHYEAKLKELDQKLDADSIYSLKNIVAKNLNFDKATHPNVGDSNLALLMFNMPRTKTQGIELLNRWQKEFTNDIKSYEKVKKMFVDNAGSFHNLIHDMNFPNVSLNAYLSDIMDRSFANLKNYQTTSESLKDLSEKFYKTSSLDMFEKSEQNTSDISEILGGAIARFARFDDPSKALFEALRSENIKKGLKEFKIADVTKDMFDPKSKEFKDIDIYDFTHYLLMVNREPNENNPTLKRLIEAVKDMQKEGEKGIIKQKFEAPSEWGHHYSEFKNDGLGAINKLLETKKGFVAGAFYKEGLGDIDLVWGNKDYGLEHILKRREKQAKNQGLNEQQAKEYALNIAKTIPEVIEKGVKVERNGRMAIEYQNIRVGLKDNWKGEKLPNHWVITGYEKRSENSESLYTSPLITKGETLPLNSNEPNSTTNALKTQEPLSEQANAKKLLKEQHAITPLKEFGTNYPEFALKPKEALEKLLQEKNGQVAGAAYREDLGGIDFVWGTPKTKDSNGYGLAHILEKREKQYKRLGLTNEQAKERTKELLKQIPEVIEKGIKDNDYIGHATIRHNGIEVGLSSQKGNTPLKNHYMITSFETDEKILRELKTIGTLSNNYRDGINYSTSNLNNPNPTTNALKTQEPLSEQANAKKLLKLESEKGIKAEALKKLDFDGIKKLIDESPRTGSSMPILGMQNFNAEAVEYIQKNHKRIAVEKIEPSFAKDLKLKYPDDSRAVIDYQAINHILKEHKNLSFEDIANYRELSKQANETLKLKDNQNRPVVASFNQINGFFVVVEQVSNAKNELILKTMYKERGNYKDSLIYKRTLAKSQNSN